MKRTTDTTPRSKRHIRTGLVLGLSALTLTAIAAGEADAKPKLERRPRPEERLERDRPETRVERPRPERTRVVVVRHGDRGRHVGHVRGVCVRPWWQSARRIEYGGRPFYFHARLGVCFGDAALALELTDAAPCGYLYLDPISGRRFESVTAYKCYVANHPHRLQLLTVVKIHA